MQPDGSVRTNAAADLAGLVDPASGEGTAGNPAPVVRPDDGVTAYAVGPFDENEDQIPEERAWTIVPGPLGLASRIVGPDGLETTYDRDADGNVERVEYPSGHAVSRTFDAKGNVLTVTDETLNGTTTFTYDPVFGQLETITDADQETTQIDLDANGNPTQITTPEGRVTEITYESRGLPERITDVFGTVTKLTYDPTTGNLLSILQGENLDPSLRRLTEITPTAEGYVGLLTDPEGRTIDTDYDPAGRITTQLLPGNRTIAFDYDPNGNLTLLTPPGRPDHAFAYTAVNLEEIYAPPQPSPPIATPETLYAYNAGREVKEILRPDGGTIRFRYDPAGRIETTTLEPSGDVFTHAYDQQTGLLQSIQSPTGTTLSFTYRGELVDTESWSGTVSGSVARTYEATGRIDSLTVNGTLTAAFDYDRDRLLTAAGDLTINRSPTTGLVSDTALGAVTDAWTYNPFGEPDTYEAKISGTPVYSVDFERDKLGRIVQKTETIQSATTVFDYHYDAAGRFEEVEEDSQTISTYTYDPNGNRLTHVTQTATTTGTYDDQDRLLEYGDAEYTYTANGELQTKIQNGETTTYEYDFLGNLRRVVLPDQTEIEYVIDGRNRRIGKKVNGVLAQGFLYEDQLNPSAELDGAGNVVSRFVYGTKSNVPDYMITYDGQGQPTGTYRIISDHLGSVRLVIDTDTGTVAQRIDYDEWGNVLLDTALSFQPFAFAGGLYDGAIGLVRFGARDYDANTGRWAAKDPISFAGGQHNLYVYADNDPLNLTDPHGHQIDPGTSTLAFIALRALQSLYGECNRGCLAAISAGTGSCVYVPFPLLATPFHRGGPTIGFFAKICSTPDGCSGSVVFGEAPNPGDT
jgi:RHS repeat-associated protein